MTWKNASPILRGRSLSLNTNNPSQFLFHIHHDEQQLTSGLCMQAMTAMAFPSHGASPNTDTSPLNLSDKFCNQQTDH